jgi:hypothetical protein
MVIGLVNGEMWIAILRQVKSQAERLTNSPTCYDFKRWEIRR